MSDALYDAMRRVRACVRIAEAAEGSDMQKRK